MVPDAVVHELEVPLALAGVEVDRHQALGEQVVAGPVAAVVVGRRGLDRQVRDAQLLVHGDLRPDPGVAGVDGRVVQPGLAPELARLRDGVEDPQALARPHVEAADVALRVAPAAGVAARAEGGAHDDHVPGDGGRGVQPDFARDRIDVLVVVQLEVDDAVLAEAGDRPPGPGRQGDQPVARRDVQDALVAAVAPVGQPASRQPPRRRLAARSLVEAVGPQQLARAGVERRHRAARAGRRVDDAVHHQRRRLELVLGDRAEIVRLEPPGDLQLVEVPRVDLVERGVARMAEVAAVRRPLAAGGTGLGPQRGAGRQQHQGRGQAAGG